MRKAIMKYDNKSQTPIRNRSTQIILLAVSLIIIGLYTWLYHYEPLPEYWNLLALDLLTALLAIAAAVTGTLLLRQFETGDKPRLVWIWFTLGWWSWVLGELVGTGYDIFNSAYGDLSVFDIFWTLGYFCFGLALYFQFRHIYGPGKKFKLINYLLMAAITFLVTLGLTQLALQAGLGQDQSWFSVYLAIFYPVCDFFIGLAALWLSVLFGRGMWGRPWWALIVFAVADGLNIFLWIGGDKLLGESTSTILDLISSILYNAGYVAAMFGLLSILLYYLTISQPKTPVPSKSLLEEQPVTSSVSN
jgi:hypothetical protein